MVGEANADIPSPNPYVDLFRKIEADPKSDAVWEETVTLARSEEGSTAGSLSFYSHVPLSEIIDVGTRLRAASVRSEQYDILTERASTGELWYDIVLGHVNDKTFAPIAQFIAEGGTHQGVALDIGSGTGNTIRAISPSFDRVIGIEKQKSVIENTKDRLPANSEIIEADATNIPVATGTVNVAVSNGLTYYFTRDQMLSYVEEIARVLRVGGKYYESYLEGEDDEILPRIEREYLTSAKAVLVCLLDRLVSAKPVPDDQRWDLNEVVDRFASLGVEYAASQPDNDGVWFIEFSKFR